VGIPLCVQIGNTEIRWSIMAFCIGRICINTSPPLGLKTETDPGPKCCVLKVLETVDKVQKTSSCNEVLYIYTDYFPGSLFCLYPQQRKESIIVPIYKKWIRLIVIIIE